MRFSLAVAVAVASISVSGLAQQNNTYKVKPSHTAEKAPKRSVAIGKTTASPATTSASRDLQKLEHQTAKSSVSVRSAGPRTPGKAPALKPAKDKPNPPINFNGSGGGKSAGTASRGANPGKGRVRQKHPH
jgi:hypothetical protein